ncbi:hypothetical protein I6B53_03835 [Schaalia sp. 19OD2882]|uniref:hypothetical protein n=1 Tax=Schaalia sp. 19OD2882 TaxID=2794089 RepID=UPI001C1ED80A|nr:hypothetical protein [Schaalia sp. 19OD2882]QWW20234.1 hypothetical protein I6B53_03835 [Schaalia sp. 19OD2882]
MSNPQQARQPLTPEQITAMQQAGAAPAQIAAAQSPYGSVSGVQCTAPQATHATEYAQPGAPVAPWVAHMPRTGWSMLVVGVLLGVWNIVNSMSLITGGLPFLQAYFQVDHFMNALQAYGSVILVPLGALVAIVGLVLNGR